MPSSALALTAAVTSGVIGGAYVVFSTMVLPALDRLGPPRAAEAMRAINAAAERPAFLLLFFGSAALATTSAVADIAGWGAADGAPDGARLRRVAGAGLVMVGFMTTITRNVPLNRRLDASTSVDAWGHYRGPWTRANSFRAAASIAGAALLSSAIPD